MTDEKLIDLVKKVDEKTTAGALKWEKTATENEFQATLASFILRVWLWESQGNQDYTLKIIDKNGTELESVSDSDLSRMIRELETYKYSGLNGLKLMQGIFRGAKRLALGVEKALDDILSELG